MSDVSKEKLNYTGKRTILIVEDNSLNRDILSAILEDEYNILTAENGQVGYEILSREYKKISLVLLDVIMPVMDGHQFLEKTRSDSLLSNVPVIVTTGSDRPEDEVKCLKLGASDFITKPYNPEVVSARVHSIIKLKESMATLAMVEYDSLTGLYTMPAFYHHAEEILQANPDKNFDICVADVKDFKMINNFYGMQKSNELLQYIADLYKKELPYGILARDNDHFYSLFESGMQFSPETGKMYYEDMVENAPVPQLTVNYGLYSHVDRSLPVSSMCNRAMIASQSIKNDFSKMFAIYDESIGNRILENQKLEQAFDAALKNQEFTVFYQPKVNPNTGKIVAAEALVRWITKDSGMISPGAFIPLFESDGLITRLDEYMFRKVCDCQKRRMAKGKEAIPVSINLSRNSIYLKDVGIIYKKIADDLGVPLNLVPIEITESATTGSDKVLILADELKRLGFSLHMDDFGTGYSSLSSLAKIPFDVLKLDKSLVDQVGKDKGEILIKHTIALAQEIGMKVVAEGVEEKYQMEFLKNAGCDLIQGFYYSKPKDEASFTKMVDEQKESTVDIETEYDNVRISANPGSTLDPEALKLMVKLGDEMMEGFLIYKAISDETIIYANRKLIEMFQCKSLEEFRAYTHNSFRGIVDSEDYDEVEKSIFRQINSNEQHDDAVEYHIKRKDGSKVYVLDEGHCVYTEAYGNIFYVFIKER